jgi:hypothetical protein
VTGGSCTTGAIDHSPQIAKPHVEAAPAKAPAANHPTPSNAANPGANKSHDRAERGCPGNVKRGG